MYNSCEVDVCSVRDRSHDISTMLKCKSRSRTFAASGERLPLASTGCRVLDEEAVDQGLELPLAELFVVYAIFAKIY